MALPLAHAHPAMRHGDLRSAVVKIAPDCVTCLPWIVKVIVAGVTTYARSPVMSACSGAPSVT
jgi:hypothetical protein